MENTVYQLARGFKQKYPKTVAWRIKKHALVAQKYINPDEKVLYVFPCQKNHFSYDIIMTYLVVITDKRIILAQKRLLFGEFVISITPDLYNDLTIQTGIFWGKVCIDTVKEVVQLSNIQKSALPEVETAISSLMMEKKAKLASHND